MGVKTNIGWCHHTFNCWRGCARKSEGCRNCYAEVLSHRNPATFGRWGPLGTRVVAAESTWRQPLAWDRAAARDGMRRRVFCGSLMDWLEDWNGPMVDSRGERIVACDGMWPCDRQAGADIEQYGLLRMSHVRGRLLTTIAQTPHLDWLLLTKRPELWDTVILRVSESGPDVASRLASRWFFHQEPPPNVWLGVSVEDQPNADGRIPWLQSIPAKVRFLSVEPLLGPIDLLSGVAAEFTRKEAWERRPIHWVIVGGESGPHHRPCEVAWITDVVEQCRAAGVPVFVKQDRGPKPERQGRIPDWAWACKQVPGEM